MPPNKRNAHRATRHAIKKAVTVTARNEGKDDALFEHIELSAKVRGYTEAHYARKVLEADMMRKAKA